MLGRSLSVWPRALCALAATAVVAALSSASAWAAPCVDGGTLAAYIAGGSCTIGDKTFSGFIYTPAASGGATAIPDSGITVRTVGPASSGAGVFNPDIGLRFVAAWSVASGQTQDSNISFDVATSAALIEDTTLSIAGAAASGTGLITVAENVFTDATLGTGIASLLASVDSSTSVLTDHATFAPRSSIHVVKDIALSGGTSGLASLSLVQNTFSQAIPEPASLLLLGTSLLGLGLARRRRKAASSQ